MTQERYLEEIWQELRAQADRAAESKGYSSEVTFTPAATSHAAGDVVGGLKEFSNIGPPNGLVSIRTARLKAKDTSAEVTGWLLKIYNAKPPSNLADDAAWDFADADFNAYKGDISLGSTGTDQGANQFAMAANGCMEVRVSASGSLWAYLVNDTTLTLPAAARLVELVAAAI